MTLMCSNIAPQGPPLSSGASKGSPDLLVTTLVCVGLLVTCKPSDSVDAR